VADDPIPRTVEWRDGAVRMIDQRVLPGRLEFIDCRTVDEVCDAISSLAVRGAPALGAAGGYGVALACAFSERGSDVEGLLRAARQAGERIVATRPTAVNLAWGVRRVLGAAEAAGRERLGLEERGVFVHRQRLVMVDAKSAEAEQREDDGGEAPGMGSGDPHGGEDRSCVPAQHIGAHREREQQPVGEPVAGRKQLRENRREAERRIAQEGIDRQRRAQAPEEQAAGAKATIARHVVTSAKLPSPGIQ